MRGPMHRLMTEKRSLGPFLAAAVISCAIPSAVLAADVCQSLWQARNAIFANKGYCFESADAQAVFGKGCFPPFGKLTPAEEADVQRIKDVEAHQNCPASPARAAGSLVDATGASALVLPKYVVQLTLSPAAASKLSSSGETVRVSASYYGTAAPGVPVEGDGEVGLANEVVDLPNGTTAINLGGISIAENDIRKTREGRPLLLINVYSSRKVFADNLLDCGIYQGDAAQAGQVEITCKLIGE
jgi:YARHG domain-containing protein